MSPWLALLDSLAAPQALCPRDLCTAPSPQGSPPLRPAASRLPAALRARAFPDTSPPSILSAAPALWPPILLPRARNQPGAERGRVLRLLPHLRVLR